MAIYEIIDQEAYFPYKIVVIVLIFLKYSFSNYLHYRQYRKLSMDSALPKEIKDLGIDEEKYKSTKVYNIAKMKYTFVEDTISTVIEVILIYLNYWAFIWGFSMNLLPISYHSEYTISWIFLSIESFRRTLIDIPFSYYKAFVLEEKFNFNKTTHFTFAKDHLISLILSLILMPLILSAIIFAIDFGGRYFYIYAEIMVIIIIFIALWIYPNFIAPLFNTFTELEEGEIKQSLYKLADKVSFPLKKIYCVDASRRTAHSNAYQYGFGNNKRIVLFDTLLKKLSTTEIEAVLGHELGHWKHSHMIKNLINTFLQCFLMLFLFGYYIDNDAIFVSFGFSQRSTFIGLSLFTLIYIPISFIFEIFTLKLSRKFEFQADEFSFRLNLAEELKSGLKKLFVENLSDMDPDPVYSEFTLPHPTFLERIAALEALKAKQK